MRRAALVVAGVVLALGLVVELAALPVATRVVGSALGRCLPFDDLRVEEVSRPVVPGLLLGRARDVELTATGLRFDEVRVERAHLTLPEVALPWSWGRPPPAVATLELELREADVQRIVAERAPFGLQPVVELSRGVASLGVEPLPARVELSVEVRDGVLRVAPVGDAPGWFDALGLDLTFELPEDVGLDRLDVVDEALLATLRVDVVPGVDGSAGCTGPLGDDAT